jgi:hypothetical protein
MDQRDYYFRQKPARAKKKKEKKRRGSLLQKFDVTERHECDHSISEIRQDVGTPECIVRDIIKMQGNIKLIGKVASAFCGLHTSRWNRNIAVTEKERL